jgi:hypothetical protein
VSLLTLVWLPLVVVESLGATESPGVLESRLAPESLLATATAPELESALGTESVLAD